MEEEGEGKTGWSVEGRLKGVDEGRPGPLPLSFVLCGDSHLSTPFLSSSTDPTSPLPGPRGRSPTRGSSPGPVTGETIAVGGHLVRGMNLVYTGDSPGRGTRRGGLQVGRGVVPVAGQSRFGPAFTENIDYGSPRVPSPYPGPPSPG